MQKTGDATGPAVAQQIMRKQRHKIFQVLDQYDLSSTEHIHALLNWAFVTPVNACKISSLTCPAGELFIVVSHLFHFRSTNEAPVFIAAFPSSARCFRRAPKTRNAHICGRTYSSPIENFNMVKSNENSLYFRLILVWAKMFNSFNF